MTRLLAALALSLLFATPGKALVLNAGDFVDFKADISAIPDRDASGNFTSLLATFFDLNPAGSALPSGGGSILFSVSTGKTLGASDIDFIDSFTSATTRTSVGDTVGSLRLALGDTLFARLSVTAGTFDVTGARFAFGDTSFNINQQIVATQVSAVPLPATLVLFLSGLGALGLMSRRRTNRAVA